MENAISIYVRTHYSAAIKDDGSLWLWGDMPHLQPSSEKLQPRPIMFMENVQTVIPYLTVLLIIKNDNSLWYCDGYAPRDGGFIGQPTPKKLMDKVASATYNSRAGRGLLIQKNDGTIRAIGEDGVGNFCTGGASVENDTLPRLALLDDVAHIDNGLAIKKNGSLWVFGENYIHDIEKFL